MMDDRTYPIYPAHCHSADTTSRKSKASTKAKKDEDLEDYLLVDEASMIKDPDGDYGGVRTTDTI